jgi:hypothetical protein
MTLKLAYEVHIQVVVSPASPVLKQVRFEAGREEPLEVAGIQAVVSSGEELEYELEPRDRLPWALGDRSYVLQKM